MEKKIELAEMKKIQLEILDYIDGLCLRENIPYFLDGGTLLGAVRHKGFIPWDDDIDIIMHRRDYERFIKIFKSNSGVYNDSRYRLLNKDNTDDYYYLFSKMIDTRTKMREKGLPVIEELGVYIDIFPLDYLPNDPIKQRKYQRRVWDERKKKDLAIAWRMREFPLYKWIFCFYFGKIVGLDRMLRRIERIVTNVNDAVPLFCNDMVAGFRKNMKTTISAFEGSTPVFFEGKERPAPVGYDAYLTTLYGDYMTLPPEEKRVSHHYFEAYWKE